MTSRPPRLSRKLASKTTNSGASPGVISLIDASNSAGLFFGAACGTILLVFFAPALQAVTPVLVVVGIFAVNAAWLLAILRLNSRGARREPFAIPDDSGADFFARTFRRVLSSRLTWPMIAFVVLCAFVFAPLYFSDDSWRHIHDGVYLLRGVDVYSVAPDQLPPIFERRPNHPHLPTIYLPITQIQAVVGAWLHPRYGFLAVYYAICFALLLAIHSELRAAECTVFAALCVSPAFLIALASRHADVQGVLFAVAALTLLRRRKSGRFFPGRYSHARFFVRPWRSFVAGVCLAAAAGLKPEGLVWAAAVAFALGTGVFAGRTRGAARLFVLLRLIVFVFGGLACGAVQIIFAREVLFPSDASWTGFLNTVRLFSDWFVAYNPVIEIREWLYPNVPRPTLILAYRTEVLMLALLWFFLPLGVGAMRRPVRARFLPAGLRGLEHGVASRLLLVGLAALIFSKGVWHPWYFLWLVLALWITGRRTVAAGLLGALPLFYLPVVYLRATGDWWMPIFYASIVIYFIGFAVSAGGRTAARSNRG